MLFRAHFFRGVQVASGDACSCKRRRVLSGQMSNEKNPGYLQYIRDYTTQLYKGF